MNKQTQKELLQKVEKNYQDIACQYNETRKKHLFPLWNELIKISKKVKEGSRVLDVGCGNGRLLEAFIGKDINYLGVDSCEELLEYARKNYKNNKFQKADILNLGTIAEYNFDYIFSIAVLHHLPGRDLRLKALKQLYNKTKSSGQVVFTVWNLWKHDKYGKLIWRFWLLKLIGKNKMDFGDILWDWKNSQGERVSQRYYHAFNKWELRRICKKVGFKIKRIYTDKFNYYVVLEKK